MNQRNHFKWTNPIAGWLALPLISLSLLAPALAGDASPRLADPPAGDGVPIETGDANGLSAMLPLLVTSSDQKRLAAELLALIQRGDLKEAESSLNAAIETGTLAIALVNRLNDPTLLSSLQGLDLQGARRLSVASAECGAPATTMAANLAQVQEALDHEQAYGGMVTRALNDLMEQYNALTARLETDASDTLLKVSELQNALRQEQRQHEAVAHELANLQADYQALQAADEPSVTPRTPEVANLEALLQQERERGDDAERRLASAREEVRNLLAFKDNELKHREAAAAARIAELENALSEARARGDASAQKLAEATEALHALQEANTHKPVSESVPPRAEAFTVLLQEDASAPASPAPSSADVSAAPHDHEPVQGNVTSALPGKESAPVQIAQLHEDVRPLSANATPVVVPARTEPAPAPQAKPNLPPPAIKQDDRLTARADELLRQGDVSGARLLLERSVKSGNARAAFLLAETFDPQVLAKLGVRGIRGDVGKAREFYAQAQTLGMKEASERLQALK